VFATSKRLLDGINPDTLLAVHNLGMMYRNQERYLEAEQMYKRVLEGREKQYDPDHTITLGPVHTLSLVYENMWRDREVEEVYRRVQEKREMFGRDHPDTMRMFGAWSCFLISRNGELNLDRMVGAREPAQTRAPEPC